MDINEITKVQISSKALRHNLKQFKKFINQVSPVIKTNAYGHGIKEIVSILNSEKVPFYTVDSFEEAMLVRSYALNTPILTIGYVSSYKRMAYQDENIYYTIVSEEMLEEWLCKITLPTIVHLKVDTGMFRQGIESNQLTNVLERIRNSKNLILEGVCTHFADADAYDTEYTNYQIGIWNDCVGVCKNYFPKLRYIHISNTAGHIHIKKAISSVSRLGVGLYGLTGNGKIDSLVSLRPVLSIISHITGLKRVPLGSRMGYNGTYISSSTLKVATIPIGYGCGLDRRLSNKGVVLIDGCTAPIIGRVCMNIAIIDVTGVPNVKYGMPVTVISDIESDENSVVSIAKICKTIPHEIVTGISQSLVRVVVDF